MSADEPYKHVLVMKLDYDNQPEVIPLNIENIVLIAYTVNRVESCLYVSETHPTALASLGIPFLQRLL